MDKPTLWAVKVYIVGSLLFLLYELCLLWYGYWPWEVEQVSGLPSVQAALLATPTALALGVLGVLLGCLQPRLGMSGRLKLACGVVYLGGTLIFSKALRVHLFREGFLSVELSLLSLAGLALLVLALGVNLVGVLRYRHEDGARS